MERNKFAAGRIREVFLNGRWIANTNFKDQLESVTWEQANHKIGSLNTIALLAFHINYYVAGLINVFKGGGLEIRDKFSFDAPPVESETDWKNRINELLENAEEFAVHLENMSDSKMDEPFVDPKYGTYMRNIEGIIEHGYYHLGQVSLLRKMVVESGK
ncbi:MAG: DUF1572 domain-containing protein [Saprospiraceae bacterium]